MKKSFIISLVLYALSFFVFQISASFALVVLGFTLILVFSYNYTAMFETHGSKVLTFLTNILPFFGKAVCVLSLVLTAFMVLVPHSYWQSQAGSIPPVIPVTGKVLIAVYMFWMGIGCYYLFCLVAYITSWNHGQQKKNLKLVR